MRGGHAHKRLKQLLIALSGSFTVTVDDGHEERKILLNRPYQGLLIQGDTHYSIHDFSNGVVCLEIE